MKYIEFLGAGGSGKTTLLNGLLSYNNYFGGKEIFDIRRWDEKYLRLLSIPPKKARIKAGEVVWWNHFRSRHSTDFIHENTMFFTELAKYAEGEKHNNALEIIMDAAAKYQLGTNTVDETEYFCLDEGFYHKTSIVAKYGDIPPEAYFNTMPKPDVLVYVDVPLEVARSREIDRDGSTPPKNVNEKGKITKQLLLDIARKRGSRVVQVENTGTLAGAIDELHKKVQQY